MKYKKLKQTVMIIVILISIVSLYYTVKLPMNDMSHIEDFLSVIIGIGVIISFQLIIVVILKTIQVLYK